MRRKIGYVIALIASMLLVAFIVLAVCLIAFTEPPVLADRTGGNSVRNMLFDFQSLFTGILAVAAALLTVGQMLMSDKGNDDRHDELVQLSLRADKLRLQRLLFPQINELRTCADELQRQTGMLPSSDTDVTEDTFIILEEVGKTVSKANGVVTRAVWSEADDLFDGELNNDVKRFQLSIQRVMMRINAIHELDRTLNHHKRAEEGDTFSRITSPKISKEDAYLRKSQNAGEMKADVDKLLDNMASVFLRLSQLAKEYRIAT